MSYAAALDHSAGRATLLDGVFYYSPNCSRNISLPPQNVDDGKVHNIFSFDSSYMEDFHQPRWWTATFGWVAFLPLQPIFSGFLLGRLAHPSRYLVQSGRGRHHLDAEFIESWLKLERYINEASVLLNTSYQVPLVRPFLPSSYGFNRFYQTRNVAGLRAELARDWFVVWMGLLSYLIAAGESKAHHTSHLPLTSVPAWYTLLAEKDSTETWVSGLQMSTICAFNCHTPRAGIFVHLLNPPHDQPTIEWYCHFSVPVWYPWTEREASAALHDPHIARLAPPSEQLQRVSGFMVRSPSPAPPPDGQVKNTTAPRPWVAFFATRERRRAAYYARETRIQKESRLHRMRDPPTVTAKVFEWDAPLHDPTNYERYSVLVSEREYTLEQYSSAQKRYDPIANEWDCCYEFGPSDPDSDDEGASGASVPPPRPSQRSPSPLLFDFDPASAHPAGEGNDLRPVPVATISPHHTSQRSPSPPPLDLNSTEDMPKYEPLEVLADYHGFVPPLPLPEGAAPVLNEKSRSIFLRILGIETDDPFFNLPISRTAMSFVASLASDKHPDASLWDLSRFNRTPLAGNERVNFLLCTGESSESKKLYFFEFGSLATAPWKLAVTNAADALHVCRLDSRWNDYEIAEHLLRRGMRMHTLLPLRDAPTSTFPKATIPIRLPGYLFTRRDYSAYVHQREALFATPRGRAAVLRGGIVWRLAVESLSFDEVLKGPSLDMVAHRNGLCLPHSVPGQSLCDDDLTHEELCLISGMYICQTGHGSQTAMKSWWPLYTTYELVKTGENYGRWTQISELEHRKWLAQIEDGRAQPLSANEWRDRLRGRKEVRKLKEATQTFSEAFLNSKVSQGGL